MLYKVRFEISSSRLMETSIGVLLSELQMEFRKYEEKPGSGLISIAKAELALLGCKYLHLTPFSKHILLGLSDCDGDGMISFEEFGPVCVEYI
jgi:hypothetical protein